LFSSESRSTVYHGLQSVDSLTPVMLCPGHLHSSSSGGGRHLCRYAKVCWVPGKEIILSRNKIFKN